MSDEPMMQFFTYQHLKPALQAVSQPFAELAEQIAHDTAAQPRAHGGTTQALGGEGLRGARRVVAR